MTHDFDFISGASDWTGLSKLEIERIANSGPRRYKRYEIKKRNGGMRRIAQPSREIKALQYFLREKILCKFPVHQAATAYVKGGSIVKNATKHAGNEFILKMDFKNFFESIVSKDFQLLCQDNKIKLSKKDSHFCVHVLFFKPPSDSQLCLSVGAPTSPMLSNAVMYKFDEIVENECGKSDIIYTRYADDLTFSAQSIDTLAHIHKFIPLTLKKLRYPKIYVNWDKLCLVSKKYRRTITGLIITNEGLVSLGRERKRHIRAMLHQYTKNKLDSDATKKLRGLLAFAKDAEIEFYRSMECKYDKLFTNLMSMAIKKRE